MLVGFLIDRMSFYSEYNFIIMFTVLMRCSQVKYNHCVNNGNVLMTTRIYLAILLVTAVLLSGWTAKY